MPNIKNNIAKSIQKLKITTIFQRRMNIDLRINNKSDFTFGVIKSDFANFQKLYNEFVKVFTDNMGGMGLPDLYSFWYTLKTLKPELIIESGVWKGATTWIIRKTLPSAKIICLDVLNVNGFIDKSELTTYYVGESFVDFSQLTMPSFDKDGTLVFFDDHQNAPERLIQAHNKGIKWCLFNDNYPQNCGSHMSISHVVQGDSRFNTNMYVEALNKFIEMMFIFPNIVGSEVRTMEGTFQTRSIFENESELKEIINDTPFPVYKDIGIEFITIDTSAFVKQSCRYRWNTLIKLT